jgi:hypothetical protein
MSLDTFYEGLEVRFKGKTGHIRFISDQYVTLCIHTHKDPMRDVCILIYSEQWKNIELLSGNRTSDEEK